MCDEKNLADWAKDTISRRQFGALTGAAALAACTAGESESKAQPAPRAGLRERGVTFATPDGRLDGFFVQPETGSHAAVILWPDIAGIREAKRNIARTLASQGHAVLVVNPYYRDVAGEQFADFAAFAAGGGFQKVGPWRAKLTAEAIMRDAKAIADWLDRQEGVSQARGIGTQGYCMGGPFTVWSAAASPRIKAAASFHGGGLVRPGDPMSPHALLGKTQASYLIAIARNDDAKAPGDKDALREAATAAARPAKVDVYAGDHGWMVPDSPAYNAAAAAQGEADLLALYKAALA
ncbi:dienelactone hydrolase family protein [Erythrobacter sp. WG]|uniref:dienelactone hydrolase family protein n=1 Tax=Erythrobacter sp. WG TaxID=2985510 RepID=UPI00226DA2E6|nr:dienelactone hydrolase family protein [Erythrobacter sp. WG]MCX9148112.1 dienelactone hydrolase family protein [Erythrobacter sp. WG]